VDGKGSWSETATIGSDVGPTISGRGQASEFLFGFYIGANASWRFSERWSLLAGAQYQYLGSYDHVFGGRKVELDMGSAIFVTAGIGFSF
jgi:hypothetical protein